MGHIPPLEDFDDPTYSPFISDELAYGDARDPYIELKKLAARGPVVEGDFRNELGMAPDATAAGKRVFMVFDYEAIRTAQANADVFSNDYFKEGLGLTYGKTITTMNPPEHPRYRKIFQKAFLPHIVGSWSQEFIEPVINTLLDKFAHRDRVELMKAFVEPYPFEIIYRQLRLPEGAEETFYKLSTALSLYQVDMAHAREASDKLGTFLEAMIAERRANPGTDLVSVLATVEDDGERLPDDLVISFLRQLINAAGDTTYRSTGSMLVALLSERPDQFELIKNDRSLIARAIEETLRWDGPININYRAVTRDTELCGVKLPKGAVIQTMSGMANRDPALFPDPGRFDLMRENARAHMAFATGPHICLGQHLARLEMTRAMNILLDRFPNLRLDPDTPRPFIQGHTMRSPKKLYVRLD
jgi:cytochrome P450